MSEKNNELIKVAKVQASEEQRAAIEHFGGVLLGAGAGAGKTFVLIEHIFYLIKCFIRDRSQESLDSFENQLKNYLSEIVLMTFTKKAAGELEVRLKKYIDKIEEGNELFEYKEILKDQISYLNVTTIHGFCFQLIMEGFVDNVDKDSRIINELEFKSKIDDLLEEYYLEHELSEEFKLTFKSLKSAFRSLFSSPEIRKLWFSNQSVENTEQFIVSEIKKLLLNFSFDEVELNEKEQAVVDTILNVEINSIEDFLVLRDKYTEIGRFPRSKNLEEIKEIRKFVKDNDENFQGYLDEYEGYLQWQKQTHSIFDFIENHYLSREGLVFSDLEYYVEQALQNEECARKINDKYKYFIIDEFQDTSEIQFSIIQSIINKNYEKIFCVGDIKQAIYGFRGGEIKLFKNLMAVVPSYKSLADNYRSEKEVIDFNNDFFEKVLNLGREFEGDDIEKVPFEKQSFPSAKEIKSTGQIKKIKIDINDENAKNLSISDLDCIEAKAILNYLKSDSEGDVCILYRKLTPLKYLLPKLIEEEIPFKAQLKISLEEDPLLSLFKLLLDGRHSSLELLESFCDYLLVPIKKLEKWCEDFQYTARKQGVWTAFCKFLYGMNIHNSNWNNNTSLIKILCLISNDDFEKCVEKVKDNKDGSYSIEFQNGVDANLTIMTVHASKGLEFDHVILGGVSTNGISKTDDVMFGNLPDSFKWTNEKGDKLKSPGMILENLYQKQKNFSESKRLLYVACTRAKKSILWTDIFLNGTPRIYSQNSWIKPLRFWENSREGFEIFEKTYLYESKEMAMDDMPGPTKTPGFHFSKMGVISSDTVKSSLKLIPELSVTRIVELENCPRQFYLNSVLKVSDNDLAMLEQENLINVKEYNTASNDLVIKSSAKRGSEIHFEIEKFIKSNFTHELIQKEVQFFSKLTESYREDYQFVSEQSLRYEFKGTVINGTPDLVLVPHHTEEGAIEIWDFKTGDDKQDNSYWMQLYFYAYFYFKLTDRNILLKLVYLDLETVHERDVSVEEVDQLLFELWEKVNKPNQVNTSYCQNCKYENLCQEV